MLQKSKAKTSFSDFYIKVDVESLLISLNILYALNRCSYCHSLCLSRAAVLLPLGTFYYITHGVTHICSVWNVIDASGINRIQLTVDTNYFDNKQSFPCSEQKKNSVK